MVSGVRTSSSTLWDSRATALDAAAKGRLGLDAAQTYIQSAAAVSSATSGAIPGGTISGDAPPAPVPQTQTDQDATSGQSSGGQGQGQAQQTPDSAGALPAFQLSASYSPMLAAQEAGSQTETNAAATNRASQATGAYAATMALTEDGVSNMEMQVPGWSDSAAAGRRINLSA